MRLRKRHAGAGVASQREIAAISPAFRGSEPDRDPGRSGRDPVSKLLPKIENKNLVAVNVELAVALRDELERLATVPSSAEIEAGVQRCAIAMLAAAPRE